MTRGAGGQNEIGPELGEALSVLRTEELLSVHRHDGVKQFFGRAVDFGYSFSVEETFQRWGREETLGDIVRVYRAFRPDVVVTMMPDGAGGGQHHQASARLAEEAVTLAGNPERFAEQLSAGLVPWTPRRLYRCPFSLDEGEEEAAIAIPVGEFDELLGMSYAEHGALARNNHRSQGMNAPGTPGSPPAWMIPSRPSGGRLFAGLSPGLGALSGLRENTGETPDHIYLSALADDAATAFRQSQWDEAADRVMEGLRYVRFVGAEARKGADPDRHLEFLLAREEEDWLDAASKAHWLVCRSRITAAPETSRTRGGALVLGDVDGLVTPGETFFVQTTVVQYQTSPVSIDRVELVAPAGWEVKALSEPLGLLSLNERRTWLHEVKVASDAPSSRPFWFRARPGDGRYEVDATAEDAMHPFRPPPLHVQVSYRSGPTQATLRRPVVHRSYDRRVGTHRNHDLQVVPGLSLRLRPQRMVLPLDGVRGDLEVTATLRNNFPRAVSADVSLQLPEGWSAKPPSASVSLGRENSERAVRFRLVPAETLERGSIIVEGVAKANGRTFDEGYRTIAYHHVQRRHVYERARVVLEVLSVRIAPDLRVGYVMGVGDEVPQAIAALGARVELLSAGELLSGKLSLYDAIVTGVRAYKARDDLITSNRRLLEYVREGGVLVVQYNKYEFNDSPVRAPILAALTGRTTGSRTRAHPCAFSCPNTRCFTIPTRSTRRDWNGWVQERGLYFLGTWDERYVPLLELEDPFDYNSGTKRGALVLARHGRGTYIYTGLGFFRQLPAGVAGAYRLFANLISLGKER